jgi:hypothetical protein
MCDMLRNDAMNMGHLHVLFYLLVLLFVIHFGDFSGNLFFSSLLFGYLHGSVELPVTFFTSLAIAVIIPHPSADDPN